jgi:hypothetical protein
VLSGQERVGTVHVPVTSVNVVPDFWAAYPDQFANDVDELGAGVAEGEASATPLLAAARTTTSSGEARTVDNIRAVLG